MRKNIISEYSIFMPTSARRIKLDYPELSEKPVFKVLSSEELVFVWYYACEVSPYYDIESDRDRIDKSMEKAFSRSGGGYTIPKALAEQYKDGSPPIRIKDAIAEMLKYRIGPRVRGLKILEKGFTKLEAILDIDAGDDKAFAGKDGTVDFSKKKAYVDTFRAAMDSMPKLIEQMEQRFSVVEVSDKNSLDEEGKGFIDNYSVTKK